VVTLSSEKPLNDFFKISQIFLKVIFFFIYKRIFENTAKKLPIKQEIAAFENLNRFDAKYFTFNQELIC
jgi:hypothetical protein